MHLKILFKYFFRDKLIKMWENDETVKPWFIPQIVLPRGWMLQINKEWIKKRQISEWLDNFLARYNGLHHLVAIVRTIILVPPHPCQITANDTQDQVYLLEIYRHPIFKSVEVAWLDE